MLILETIRSIPAGRVASYGQVAIMAGYPSGAAGARQVARILSSMSRKHDLPWWRVVKKGGYIALPEGEGRELQRRLLEAEGLEFETAIKIKL